MPLSSPRSLLLTLISPRKKTHRSLRHPLLADSRGNSAPPSFPPPDLSRPASRSGATKLLPRVTASPSSPLPIVPRVSGPSPGHRRRLPSDRPRWIWHSPCWISAPPCTTSSHRWPTSTARSEARGAGSAPHRLDTATAGGRGLSPGIDLYSSKRPRLGSMALFVVGCCLARTPGLVSPAAATWPRCGSCGCYSLASLADKVGLQITGGKESHQRSHNSGSLGELGCYLQE